jgi:uncharacterized protein YidB (DUF937 family)
MRGATECRYRARNLFTLPAIPCLLEEEHDMGLFDQGLGGRGGMSPAAIALLGLLAVKGFENRDKLGSMLNGVLGGKADDEPNSGAAAGGGGLGGLLGGLGSVLGSGASAGSVASGGLGDLLKGFNQSGHGEVANSWVKDGPNAAPAPQQVEQAVGPDVIDQLSKATGLSRDELLQRLTRELPKAVDGLTPDGHLPTASEADAAFGSR